LHLQVAAAKGRRVATLLDTKGPEIRTAMVRGGQPLVLEPGQEVTLVAVGEAYETWEGYKDEATGEALVLCCDVMARRLWCTPFRGIVG
jgi:pyruvate kinase